METRLTANPAFQEASSTPPVTLAPAVFLLARLASAPTPVTAPHVPTESL